MVHVVWLNVDAMNPGGKGRNNRCMHLFVIADRLTFYYISRNQCALHNIIMHVHASSSCRPERALTFKDIDPTQADSILFPYFGLYSVHTILMVS